jgi:hypothetical protein
MVAQILTQQSSQTKNYPTRIVSVVFGNPRSEECAGYGICRLDEDWPIPGQTTPLPKPPKDINDCLSGCCRGVATVERWAIKEGKISLSFRFLKSDLTSETVKKYFGETHFRIGSALYLPNSLTAAYDMPPSVLAAGLHPIVETPTHFQILIQTH